MDAGLNGLVWGYERAFCLFSASAVVGCAGCVLDFIGGTAKTSSRKASSWYLDGSILAGGVVDTIATLLTGGSGLILEAGGRR